jgi:glycosyltransferase involved in cell wall biosynthesis
MYECTSLPQKWIAPLAKADLIVVPCKQNKYLFEKYTKNPVEVCSEGVEVDKYTYFERMFPVERPFVYLWLGATNPRKGTDHVIMAWELLNKYWYDHDNEVRKKILLVMKTTQEADRECPIEIIIKNGGILDRKREIIEKKIMLPAVREMSIAGNVILDTRRLPVLPEGQPNFNYPQSLQEVYHSAHCFLLPTRGEGFGLTLAEAMSTGLPCIYTPWSGPVDFCNDTMAYPLKFKFSPVKTIQLNKDGTKTISHESTAADADVLHMVRRMIQVYKDYDLALQKGKRAAEHIRKGFTWDISAASMIKIIEKYTNERLEKAA